MSRYARAIFLMVGLLAGAAEAATCTSVRSGNWNNSSTWSCTGGVTRPGGGDDAIIVSPHTVTLNNSYSVTNLTIQAGATFDNTNNRRLTASGSVVIDGTYDATGNRGRLIMIGNGQTLSGTGTIIDINRIQIDANITIPAGSDLDLTLRSEIRVGNNNPATLTIDGTITGTSQTNGNRILRVENNNTSNVIINGTFTAPNSFVEVQAGGTVTNNGTVSLQNLDGDNAATATWTQGANANLTMTQPMVAWSGTFSASATDNTVTLDGTATPLDPMTYFNLAGANVTCPLSAGITILGLSPCGPPTGGTVTSSPTLCVNDTSIGTQPWSGLANVTAQDNVYATATASNSQITNYLKCTGYNFAIPAGATITGITVGPWVNATWTYTVNAMQLVKTDVIQPTNLAVGDTIPNGGGSMRPAPTQLLFGSSTNLWGNTWTSADINDPTFGAAFVAQRGAFATTQTVGVDAMPITITYTTGGAGTVTANPTLCVNDTGIGTQAWGGLANVTAQDNVYATAIASNSQITNYLKCTGYNFAIPAGATITGITAGPWVNATWTYTVNAMQLVKTDVIQPTNLAVGDTIPNGGGSMRPAPTQLLFGSSTNLWGNTWTSADINDPTFGAAFAAQRGAFATTQTVGVDAMPITIDYTTSGGGTPTTVVYYHDTTNGVAIGVDGPTNVISGTNVTIPPIITASLITANTCTGNARSQNHPAGLYTHSRWYLTTDYAVATEISANPTGSARIRGRRNRGTVTVRLYDYDPVSGAKTLIGSSATISISNNTVNYPYTISSSLYTVPAGHRLMLQYDFDQPRSGHRARVYCSSTGSYITVTETPVSEPVAEYRMDEASWNGTANEVVDSSANALHGSAFLGATTAAARICNGANLAANYVEVPDNALLDITSRLTVTAWIRPARWGGAPGDALMSFISKDTNYEAHVNSTGNINWWWGTGNITSAATAPVGAWTHVAMVYSDGSQTLYINGASSGTNTVAGALPTNASPLQIGDDQGFGGGTRRFDGMIDEVKIFSSALTPSQIATGYTNENAGNNWDGSTRTCPTYPDHYELSLPSGSITCLETTATVTACADTSSPCTNPATSIAGQTATLATSAGALASTTVTFDASGVASTTLSYPAATDGAIAAVTLSGETVTATNSRLCCQNGTCAVGDSCTTTFNTSGFIFSSTTGGSAATIPTQEAGTTSSTYYLRAVRTNTTTQACESALSGANTVNFGYECNNPTTCSASDLMSVNGGTATLIARNNNGTWGNSTSVDMTFDANGNAPFTFNYSDVGQVTLHASKAAGGSLLSDLTGASNNAFVVKPGGFVLSQIKCTTADAANCGAGALAMGTPGDNPAASTTGEATFIRAGDAFSVTVTATTSGGATTPNYGKESSPESVLLTPTNVLAGMVAAPAVGGSFGSFASGAATGTDFTWDEVGIITLAPSVGDGNYLGVGDVTGTTSGNVGRFYPHHFDTVVSQVADVPMGCPASLTCPTSYNGIAYSGQAFGLTVTAMNAGGGVTSNYNTAATGLAKTTTLSATGALGADTAPTAGALGVTSVSAFAAGTITSNAQMYTFTAASAPSDIFIRAIDTDVVSSKRLTNPTTTSVEGGVKVVSGRIKVSNAYGSELLPLTLSATAQYYTANGWTNSTTDSVTPLNVPGSYTVGSGSSTTTLTPVTGILALGVLNIRLGPPSGGATGEATVSPGAPAFLPVIPGTATFGVYNSNNGFIYRRENY